MYADLVKFPLDLTGTESHNRVMGEVHDLSKYANLPYRPVVLDHGYFFSDTIQAIDGSGYTLVKDVDFQLTGLNAEATALTGREVCCVLVIVNPRVTSSVIVDANMVGGRFTHPSKTIANLAMTLLNDTRSTSWINIKDRPNAFVPSGHTHPMWQLYGFETYRDKLQHITDLLLAGSRAEVAKMEVLLLARFAALQDQRQNELAGLQLHISNLSNPHQVTKAQVGLGNVQDFAIASTAESSVVGTARTDRYMTPRTTKLNIDANFTGALNQHIGNTNNPHGDTPDQVNAYANPDVNTKFLALLGLNEQAVASNRLTGWLWSDLYATCRASLSANAVTAGRFDPSQLGSNVSGVDKVLMGNGQWVSVSTLVAASAPVTTPVYYIGYLGGLIAPNGQGGTTGGMNRPECYNFVVANYSGVPVGTIILFHDRFYRRVGWSGRTTTPTNMQNMKAMQRTFTGWEGPYLTESEIDWRTNHN